MSLRYVVGNGLSTWEEKLLAAAYLLGVRLDGGCFEENTGQKLEKASEDLNGLPPLWAKELSIATLFSSDAEI